MSFYTSEVFHEKRSLYALLIGVYNENGLFTKQLLALQAYRKEVDIIIADGGSSDGATSVAALGSSVRALLINVGDKRGLSAQYRGAMEFALAEGYAGVIMMDGNGKDGVEALPEFIKKLQAGYDFVQGSRFMPGGVHRNTPFVRILAIRCIFNPVMRLATGFVYTDGMNGFKACRRSFLLDSRIQPLREIFVRYNLQYYLNYIAPRLQFKITEIPVRRVYSSDGSAHSKIRKVTTHIGILGELAATVLGFYNPNR
jgi:dolichol-phosphate mannosyltransferase